MVGTDLSWAHLSTVARNLFGDTFMRYKVIKGLPFAEVGEEVEVTEGVDGWSVGGSFWPALWCDPRESGFFEAIPEHKLPNDRWLPGNEERYFAVSPELDVYETLHRTDQRFTTCKPHVGNYFRTRDQAKELARRWKKCAEEYQQEILEKGV